MKTQGEIEAAICQGITHFEQEYRGRGPKDIHAYFRWGHFRERRYEGQILVPMHRRKDEKRQDYLDRWTESIRSNVRQERDCMYAPLVLCAGPCAGSQYQQLPLAWLEPGVAEDAGAERSHA